VTPRPLALPERDLASEEAFVAALGAEQDDTRVIAAIEAALAERRPQLAARLVSLLDDNVSDELIERARRARRFRVEEKPEGPDVWDNAFAEFVKRRNRRRSPRHRRRR
jgi:hypothetical protein